MVSGIVRTRPASLQWDGCQLRRIFLFLLINRLVSALVAAGPPCAELSKSVYTIKLHDPMRTPTQGLYVVGGEIFLSQDGTFLTAMHLFEQSPNAARVWVEVNDGSRWVECRRWNCG